MKTSLSFRSSSELIDVSDKNHHGEKIYESDLFSLDFSSFTFDECNLWKTTFEFCSLRNTSFKNATLHKVRFHYCDLRGVDFTGASIDSFNFNTCILDNGVFNTLSELGSGRIYFFDSNSEYIEIELESKDFKPFDYSSLHEKLLEYEVNVLSFE